MKDERIREIADEGLRMTAGGTEEFFAFTSAIQTALAERDREVAEWAECGDNHFEVISAFDEDQTDTVVYLSALLHFLEAQP